MLGRCSRLLPRVHFTPRANASQSEKRGNNLEASRDARASHTKSIMNQQKGGGEDKQTNIMLEDV